MSTTVTTTKNPATASKPLSLRGLVTWLIAKDQAYKDAELMRDLPPHILRDVGLIDTPKGLQRR